MNTQRSAISSLRVATAALSLATLFTPHALSAATVTWGGSSGEYTTGANWVGNSVPNTNGGDTAVINGGAVTYTPGGDLSITNGGSLQINGGSWTQVVGGAWIQLGNGSIVVNGGTFNLGTAGQINKASGATITVQSGAFNYGTNVNLAFEAGQSLNISGGSFTLGGTGEFVNSGGTTTLSGGSLNAALMKFAGAASTNLDFSNGAITLSDTRLAYIIFKEGAATSYLNFTAASTGVLNLTSISATDALALINRGDVRVNGIADSSQFTITENGMGSSIFLTASTVPEPSTAAALAGAAILGFAATRRRRV